jgi:hypothetical protein
VTSFASHCPREDNLDEESDRPNELLYERMAREDFVSHWLEKLPLHDQMESIELENEMVETVGVVDGKFTSYSQAVSKSHAREWLIANLRKDILLGPAEPVPGPTIKQQFRALLPRPAKMSRSTPCKSYHAKFHLPWDPMSFVRDQQYSEALEEVLETIITLSGSKKDA